MTTYRFLTTPDAVAAAVRGARAEQKLSQAELATRAHVDRRFIIELEAGHPRSELGKVLCVLEALDIHATALPGPPLQERPAINLTEVVSRFA